MQSDSALNQLLRSTIAKAAERKYGCVMPDKVWDVLEDALETDDERIAQCIMSNLELMQYPFAEVWAHHREMLSSTLVVAWLKPHVTEEAIATAMDLLEAYWGERSA